ncbi:MAG: flippase-like domain-containing protein, partial [Rikenella sp.]|nr:flippase-like domain-containing protein [Rikenella sp.]
MEKNTVGRVRWWKIVLPVLLGLGLVAWMIARDFDPAIFDHVRFTGHALLFILLAFLFMVGRDLGYIVRIRLFSRGELGWRQAFRIIMLWEFTSAVTPSAIGGTGVAVVFVHKEGLPVGRSAAIVMLTSFFDELYFALIFPIVSFIVGGD